MAMLLSQSSTASTSQKLSIDIKNVTTIILAGGNGTRLSPLTDTRCKPAVCFGGKYRLIDIPISNAIHSGCRKIFIISQYLSSSLHQHIFNTFHSGAFPGTAIELISAEQKPNQKTWYQGTACAVRQNMQYFMEMPSDYVLILSGDQIYSMNYLHMLDFAKETNADLVIATLPVNEEDAKRMGVMKLGKGFFINEFYEKPQTKDLLDQLRIPFTEKASSSSKQKPFLGSMGIYLFKRQALIDLMRNDTREDFGKHLIPTKVKEGGVAAYIHDGYWEDIGTIESYFKANIALTSLNSEFNFEGEGKPIFYRQHYLPAPKINNSMIMNSIICEGCIIETSEIINSIIGLRSTIKQGGIIRHTYVMGNDFSTNYPSIGENCVIDHAIIDKNVCIGNNVRLINKDKLMSYTSDKIYVRDGVIIVTKGSNIPDGFIF